MENLWHHRKVADTASKACMICYKPSSSVLIMPDNKDFFYICPSHLKDRNFAVPTEDELKAAEERKKKEEMDKEIEKIKAEYEEKLRKKKEKKDKKKGKDEKEEKKDEGKSEEELEKEKQDKINAVSKQESKTDDGPRIFRLQKHFYNMRLEKMRTAELAKRNRERLRNPATFPSVPTGQLGSPPAPPP
ncbi:DUF1742-domain-containing protein [Myriangium duriaei CBS 260.36]|uniref:DUF1742-domain-containing protein n=1 Tax=Myriangium duriaei CBS 260.36 TaxID=1168546 RepID=A0A9P4J568_9PEZI|nr:DUF1742-domain-containing protein [Myriangium duriaei CBS 260.36]